MACQESPGLALGSPAPRGKGPSWGVEKWGCSLGWGPALQDPSLAREAGDEVLLCPVPPCLGRRWEACTHARIGGFLVRYQLLICPSVRLCSGGGGPFPMVRPSWLCLPGMRQGPHHFVSVPRCKCPMGCPGGMRHLQWNHGVQACSSTTPWVRVCREGPGRVQVPALGRGTGEHFTMRHSPAANHRAPLSPRLPPALPGPPIAACACLCSGAARAQEWGPEADGVGGGGGLGTGWSESEPGICRMSPYPDSLCFPVSISTVLLQPPAGGWQGALWGGGEIAACSPLAHLPFPSPLAPGVRDPQL